MPRGATCDWFFWDAYCKGLLPADADRRQAVAAWLRRHAPDPHLSELTRGLRVDAVVYSRDLWTGLAHDRFSTIWTPLLATPFTRPRRTYADLDATLVSVSRDVRYPAASARDNPGLPARGCRPRTVNPFPESGEGTRPRLPSHSARSNAAAGRALQPVLRGTTQCRRTGRLPGILPLPGPRPGKAGVRGLAVETDCGEEDFFDLCHLNGSGGRKLAAQVARRRTPSCSPSRL